MRISAEIAWYAAAAWLMKIAVDHAAALWNALALCV